MYLCIWHDVTTPCIHPCIYLYICHEVMYVCMVMYALRVLSGHVSIHPCIMYVSIHLSCMYPSMYHVCIHPCISPRMSPSIHAIHSVCDYLLGSRSRIYLGAIFLSFSPRHQFHSTHSPALTHRLNIPRAFGGSVKACAAAIHSVCDYLLGSGTRLADWHDVMASSSCA
jgi:hypothetical protein